MLLVDSVLFLVETFIRHSPDTPTGHLVTAMVSSIRIPKSRTYERRFIYGTYHYSIVRVLLYCTISRLS